MIVFFVEYLDVIDKCVWIDCFDYVVECEGGYVDSG